MAKTTEAGKKARTPRKRLPKASRPTETRKSGEWTAEELIAVLNASSVEEDIESLKRAGILTKEGKVAKLYLSWGNKVSRTPEIDESGELRG